MTQITENLKWQLKKFELQSKKSELEFLYSQDPLQLVRTSSMCGGEKGRR